MKNKKGFTVVEVLVSFILIVVVVIYLIRTIIVVSNKNNQLLTEQEFTVYEDTFLTDIYKDIDIVYNVENFHPLQDDSSNNQITLTDVSKVLTIDKTNERLIYDDKIYKLPDNVTLRQNDGRYYVISTKSGIRPYQIIKIYVSVDGKDEDIKILYQNKNLADLTITFDPDGGTFTSCTSPYSMNNDTSMCQFTGKYKTVVPAAPKVTKDKYVFDGWYTQSGEKFTEGGILTENVTYIARWKEKEYPIIYDLKGGRGGGIPTTTGGEAIACASENEDCQLSEVSSGALDDATRLVCYGAKDSYNCKQIHNQTPCNNETFGDPLYGTAKKCYEDIYLPTSIALSTDYTILKNFNDPTKEGYNFQYWQFNNLMSDSSLSSNLPVNYVNYTGNPTNIARFNGFKSSIYANGKLNASAVWSAKNLRLTLDPDGGTYTPNANSNCSQKSGTSLYQCTMTYDSSNNNIVGAPTRGTDIFLGWYTSDGVQVYNASGQNVAATGYWSAAYSSGVWKKASNVTLTAHYRVNNCYSISYNLNGGTVSSANKTSYCNTTAGFTLNNPTKYCNAFKGWSGTGLTGDTNKTVTIPTNSSGNRSYTANWTPNTYSISYNCNGGSGSMAATTVTFGTPVTLRANACSKTGHTFAGWATSAGGNVSYSNGATINPSSCGNITLYAKWTTNTYHVDYVCPGLNNASETCTYGQTVTINKTCSPTGYHHKGWKLINTSSYITSFTCNGDKVLQADYDPNTYQIKYHGNTGNGDEYKKRLKDGKYDAGGEFSNNTFYHYKKFYYDSSSALATNRFVKSGYTFVGWNTKSDGKGIYYLDKENVRNLTATHNGIVNLYAIWQKNSSSSSTTCGNFCPCTSSRTKYIVYTDQTSSSCTSSHPGYKFTCAAVGGYAAGSCLNSVSGTGNCYTTYSESYTTNCYCCADMNGTFSNFTGN